MKLAFAAAAAAIAFAAPMTAAEAAIVTRYFSGTFYIDYGDTAFINLKDKNFRGSFSYETVEVTPSDGSNGSEAIAIDALKQLTVETEFFEVRFDFGTDPLDLDIGTYANPGEIYLLGAITQNLVPYTARGISDPTEGWFYLYAGPLAYDGIRLPENPDFSQVTSAQLDFFIRSEEHSLFAGAVGTIRITDQQEPLAPNTGPINPGPVNPGPVTPGPVAPVPEPATWAMMLGGFGLIGGLARRRAGPKPRPT